MSLSRRRLLWPAASFGKRLGEPGLRINAVELAGLDHAGDDGLMIASIIRPGEQRVLSTDLSPVG
jgi:hypothetical protein